MPLVVQCPTCGEYTRKPKHKCTGKTAKPAASTPPPEAPCTKPGGPHEGLACACMQCRPVGYCVEDPCLDCDGPVAKRCEPPEEE